MSMPSSPAVLLFHTPTPTPNPNYTHSNTHRSLPVFRRCTDYLSLLILTLIVLILSPSSYDTSTPLLHITAATASSSSSRSLSVQSSSAATEHPRIGEYYNKDGLVRDHTRFAYVTLHYEGTERDDEYLLGLRVLIRSLQHTSTPYDIIVLLSTNVRESSRNQLLADGCIIKIVENIPNPFKGDVSQHAHSSSYKARFEHTFNKLYIWLLTEYERVIYMDSDNIALSNLDHTFYCGSFCVVFMNPLLFHTGLMVVKPDISEFHRLNNTLQNTQNPAFSHDGADQGFLVTQFDVEDAPLFHPKNLQPVSPTCYDPNYVSCEYHPMSVSEMRLPLGYNMNHFYYYPTFDWNFFTRTDYYFANHSIPALTLAYPAAPWLKPWYWYPIFFFTENRHWHRIRNTLEDQVYWHVALTRCLLVVFMIIISRYIARPALANSMSSVDDNTSNSSSIKCSILGSIRNKLHTFLSLSPWISGYFIGVLMWLLVSFISFTLIPPLTPPLIAFTCFALIHVNLMYICITHYTQIITPRHRSIYIDNGYRVYILLWCALSMNTVFFLPLYPHFVPKIAVIVFGMFYWCVIDAHMYRRANERAMSKSTITV